jgi:predicted nucleotidyltransferase
MPPTPSYPTDAHARAADAIVEFFAARDETDAVLLVNSCARGKATRDSCLDITVLVPDGMDIAALDTAWQRHHASDPVFAALHEAGRFSVVHLDIEDGDCDPDPHPDDEYPDFFEVHIGNLVAYSAPLWERGDHLARLRQRWLPYYQDDLRRERLAEVRWCCQHYLEHIPPYVERGLSFQAFARLWSAFQMFLQALFITRRTYPIAYDKWIHEQVVEMLGLPDLYAQLPPLFEIERFESAEVVGKARDLQRLLDTFVEA